MFRIALGAALIQGACAFSGPATDEAFSFGARSTRSSTRRGRSRERDTRTTVDVYTDDEAAGDDDGIPAEKAAELAGAQKQRSDTRGAVPPFFPHWLGDGYCDRGAYNTLENGWDKGDCCQHTCKDGPLYKCDANRALLDCKAGEELAQVKQELARVSQELAQVKPELARVSQELETKAKPELARVKQELTQCTQECPWWASPKCQEDCDARFAEEESACFAACDVNGHDSNCWAEQCFPVWKPKIRQCKESCPPMADVPALMQSLMRNPELIQQMRADPQMRQIMEGAPCTCTCPTCPRIPEDCMNIPAQCESNGRAGRRLEYNADRTKVKWRNCDVFVCRHSRFQVERTQEERNCVETWGDVTNG